MSTTTLEEKLLAVITEQLPQSHVGVLREYLTKAAANEKEIATLRQRSDAFRQELDRVSELLRQSKEQTTTAEKAAKSASDALAETRRGKRLSPPRPHAGAMPLPVAGAGDPGAIKSPRGPRAAEKAATKPVPLPAGETAVHVYTDGACTGNPGPMGIGVVCLDPALGTAGRREISAYLGEGTNNIAELTAIARGLEDVSRSRHVVVYTDSSYCIGVLAKGWKAKANTDLIASMRRQLGEFASVRFVKVQGHAGVPENERCDELARTAVATRKRS